MISPTLNIAAERNFRFLKEALYYKNKNPRMLCVGSGFGKGEGIKILGPEVIGIDIKFNSNLDIVCDGQILPFKDSSFDAVILQALLEHVKDYQAVIQEALRVLKNDAYIYVEVPFLQGRHSEADYRRFTLQGLKLELSEFKEIKSGICVGPFSSFVWVTTILLSLVFSLNNEWLFQKLRAFFLCLLYPFKFFDVFYSRSKDAEIISSAFYFIGKKGNTKN